jgi:asparagine synthase (glutamine-hydrolysing)
MTLLAGIFNRSPTQPVSRERVQMLRRGISRHPTDTVLVSGDESAVVIKVDVGAFGVPGMLQDDEATTMVAGEPIVAAGSAETRSRAADVACLHEAMKLKQYARLRDARGTFSCAHFARDDRRLVLATDKLGIRPIYWWADAESLVFSSTLRLLESLTWIAKRPDLRGLGEEVAFGFPLGARTAYEGICLLNAGTVLECTSSGITSNEYWRWQDVPTSSVDLETSTRRSYEAFMEAVRVRQGRDRYATAFLSGGLDSRCVVAALRASNVAVHSFNFARPNTEDRVYGAALARAAGSVHEEALMDDEIDVRWSSMIANARVASSRPIKALVERPGLIWSGDGGSVGLGHVYIRPRMVQLSERGDLEGLAEAYVEAERAVVPRRLLADDVEPLMTAAPRQGVMEELNRLRTPDLLQTFYFMLLHNDQHRHLHNHFENVDLHRIELQLPFFDAEFLSTIVEIPIQARLYHHFYNAWLSRFPPYVSTIYWQAYPGHESCPIPRGQDLAYQWDPSFNAAKRRTARRQTVRIAFETLRSSTFARGMMKRSTLTAAALLQQLGLREMDHIIYAARAIQHCWDVGLGSDA